MARNRRLSFRTLFSPTQRSERTKRWHKRFPKFSFTPWQSSRIVENVCGWFRGSVAASRAVRLATGSQCVGVGYGRQLGLEGLEERQMLSAVPFTGSYSQHFDTLPTVASGWTNDATLPAWSLFTKDNLPISTINAGVGTNGTGSFYSFGTSSERALGGVASSSAYFGSPATGAVAGYVAVALQNITGATVNSLSLQYTGEQWRDSGDPAVQSMDLQYGFGTSFAGVGTWVNAGAGFNFASPIHSSVGALDGNAAPNRSSQGGTLSSLNWSNGSTLWIRWVERNDTGDDHGLAIDNVSIVSQTPTTSTIVNPIGNQSGHEFGYAIAQSGNYLVVGAPRNDSGPLPVHAGAVYVYDLSSSTPTSPIFTLNNPLPTSVDEFGTSVAISGNIIVVGAPFRDIGATDSGSAFVYDLSSGTPTTPVLTLVNPSPAVSDLFGYSVAVSGTKIVVGAYNDDTAGSNAGAAYVYDLLSGTPSAPVHSLINPTPAANDFFGASVAISGNRVAVGAYADDTGASDAGSAYIYDLSSGTPTTPAFTLNNPAPGPSDIFGFTVAISGARVVVGAYADDAFAGDAGSAYVYDLTSGTPTTPSVVLNNPAPALSDWFGHSVAIDGTNVVVGARLDDPAGVDAGAAHTYDLSSASPSTPVATLTSATPRQSEQYGFSVSVGGGRVAYSGLNENANPGFNGGVSVISLANPLVGPAFPPPGGVTFTPTGAGPGQPGGRTISYDFSANPYVGNFDDSDVLYWGPNTNTNMSLAGAGNTLPFRAGDLVSLTATQAIWQRNDIRLDTNGDNVSDATVQGRLVLNVSGVVGSLLGPAEIPYGTTNNIGVLVPVRDSAYAANFIFEVFNGSTWVPADVYYDSASTGTGGAIKNFSGSFWSRDDFDVSTPTDSDGTTNSVNENTPLGTPVGITASAQDLDGINNAVTYTLSDSAGGRFQIGSTSGVVTRTGVALDRETAGSSLNITVLATSPDGSTASQTFAIAIGDVSEFNVTTPVDNDGAANAVDENASAGTAVGITAFASDADATNNTVSYSLSNSAGGRFQIDPVTGVVTTTGAAINREIDGPTLGIIVLATSSDSSTSSALFSIAINDLDEVDVSTPVDNNAATNAVNENALANIAVGITAFATDADATNNTVTYSLTDDAGGRFQIDPVTGIVTTTGAAIDREIDGPTLSITVLATSSDTSTASASFSIAINDVDEADVSTPVDNDGATNAVNEGVPQLTAVGITAFASDADATNNTITYSLSDNAGGRFQIDGTTGVVTTGPTVIDRETDGPTLSITVLATSSDGSSASQTFAIAINDVDEADVTTPVDNNAATNAINENAPANTPVGITAFAADADATNNTVTYSLTADAGGRFQIHPSTGVVTATGTAIDREADGPTLSITVLATSSDGSTASQSFSIAVNDVDEFNVTAPTDSDAAADSVNENSPPLTPVGLTAFAADADATNNTVTYSLTDSAGGRFQIDPMTGVVSTGATNIDRETDGPSLNITIQAQSSDGSVASQTFAIAVQPLNDNNPAFTSSATPSVGENNTLAVALSATDADLPPQTVTFSITGGADGGLFSIAGGNQLVFNAPPNFEAPADAGANNVYDVQVTASDGLGGLTVQNIAVTVTDVAETLVVDAAAFAAAAGAITIKVVGSQVRVFATGDVTMTPLVPPHAVGSVTDIVVTGRDGLNDKLTVDFSGGSPVPTGGLDFDGGAAGDDALVLIGGGLSATYTPDALTFGSGVVTVGGNPVEFSDLEPVDLTGFATVTVASPANAANSLNVAAGFDSATGTTPAIVVTGNTGLGMTQIESAHLYNNTNVVLDTSATTGAGANTITITGAIALGHANANVTLKTNASGELTFNGDLAASGVITLDSPTVNLNFDIATVGKTTTAAVTTFNVDDAPSGRVQDALALDSDGDTINIRSGTYTGTWTVDNSVTILGQSAATVIVNAGGSPGAAIADDKTVAIDNVTLQSFGVAGTGIDVKGTLNLTNSVINGGLIGVNVDGSGTFEGDLVMSGTKVQNSQVISLNVGGAGATATVDHSEFSVIAGGTAGVHASEGVVVVTTSSFSAVSTTSRGVLATSNANVTVTDSSFEGIPTGGFAVTNATVSNTLNASRNWWKTNVESAVLARTEGAVDVTPYLDSATETLAGSTATGFDSTYAHVHVTDGGIQTGIVGRLQEGVAAVAVGGIVTVEDGLYDETVTLNKSLTFQGVSLPTITRTAGSNQRLITVTAPNVTIDGFDLAVARPFATAGIYAEESLGDFSNLSVLNNDITSSGSGGTVPNPHIPTTSSAGIALLGNGGGFENVTIKGNQILATGLSAVARGIWLREVTATVGGPTLAERNEIIATTQDLLVQFAVGAGTTIENNIFTGAGVDLTEPGPGAGPITVLNNQFLPVSPLFPQSLLVKHNYAATPVIVSGNTFTGHTTGIYDGGSLNVSIQNNVFTPAAAAVNPVNLLVDTRWPGTQGPPYNANSVTIQGNTFNTGGASNATALLVRNDNGTQAGTDFSSITLGGAGALNNLFNAGFTNFIRLAPDNLLVPTSEAANIDIDASQNQFDLGSGLKLPAAFTVTENFLMEGKVFHKVDDTTVGLVTWAPNTIFVPDVDLVPSTGPTDNDYTRIKNAVEAAGDGFKIKLQGTFDWTEANAAASWALGNDGIVSAADDYSILVPDGLDNVTFEASGALGSAVIEGPGDLTTVNLESFLVFDGPQNVGWTIQNLEIRDFDLALGFFASTATAFTGTSILNNHIVVPADWNATVAPADASQNIAIHYSFGKNQTIQGNVIDLDQSTASDSDNGRFATSVGMQSNTSGGDVYDGLLIDGNDINVYGAQAADSGVILGIWENGHAHSSDVTVSNNDFINHDAGNNPLANLQRAFRVTSHSSATTTVAYTGNTVAGANIGFQWIAGSDFSAQQPVQVTGNTLTNINTGFLVQSNGQATLSGNSITGASGIGVDVASGSNVVISSGTFQNLDIGVLTAGSGSISGVNFNSGVDNDTDIQLLPGAGVVTLGAGNLFGGADYFIDNASANSFDLAALGYGAANYEGLNPATLADAFAIENRLRHKVDVGNGAAGLIRVVANNLYVTTPNAEVGISNETIQGAVNAAFAGDTINIQAGTYDEAVIVDEDVTLDGEGNGLAILTRTAGSNQALIDVQASGVTIDGLKFIVAQPFAVAGIYMGSTTATPYDNLTVTNSTFEITGAAVAGAADAYVGFDTSSTAIAVRGQGTYPNSPTVTITNNQILPTLGVTTAMFDRAIFLREANGLIQGNTIYGDAHDLAAQFVGGGTGLIPAVLVVDNNQFRGKGGRDTKGAQVDFTEPDSHGAIVVTNNTFTPFAGATTSGSSHVRSLMVKNNNSGASVLIDGNTFTAVSEVGLLLANAKAATVTNNVFSAATGDSSFVYVQVTNKVPTGGAIAANQLNATIQGNTFNEGDVVGGGRALEFLNHNSVGATFGSIVIGGAGALANTFEDGLGAYISLDGETGPSTASGRPYYAAYGLTTMAPWSFSLDAQNNKFGVAGSEKLPSIMTTSELFDVEDRIVHGPDNAALGVVTVIPNHLYVTTPGTGITNETIQNAVDVATSGNTVHIEAGAYTGNVSTVGKAITLEIGASPAQVTINGDLTLDGDDTLHLEINGLTAGTQFDQLVVNGLVNLGGATLSTALSTIVATNGQSVRIIDNNLADPVSGTFAGLANGATLTVNGQLFQIFYDGGNGNDVVLVRIPVAPAPSVVFVDDSWSGFFNGDDADLLDDSVDGVPASYTAAWGAGLNGSAIGYDQFDTIQEAINAVAPGGTIYVYAGNYDDDAVLTISKALSLKGAQATFDARSRVAPVADESVIAASVAVDALVEVSAAGVTIDGFTIDGGDGDATRAIRVNGFDGAVVQNNIITAAGRAVQYNGAPAGNTGGLVTFNRIENLDGAETYGVLAFDASYASVVNNDMTGVDVGIFEQYFYQPNGGGNAANVISGNEISAALLGYGTNERSTAAATTALSNNVYTIGAGGTGVQLYNIYKTDGVTLTGETINLSGAGTGVYGYINGGSATITNSSITGDSTAGSIGVKLTNYLPDFASYATSFSSVPGGITISGSSISNVTTGVVVEDAFADFDPNGALPPVPDGIDDATGSVTVTIQGGTNIFSTATGVLATGAAAGAVLNNSNVYNNGIGVRLTDASGTLSGNAIHNNTTGVTAYGSSVLTMNGGGTVSQNTSAGVYVEGDGVGDSTVNLSNTTFTDNGASGGGGTGDISFWQYNGDATLSDLVLTNAGNGARFGIQFRGVSAADPAGAAGAGVQPMGAVSLNDIDVSGKYRTQMIGIQRYSTVDNLTFTDVELGGATSEITGTFGASLRFDGVGFGNVGTPETLSLGNTYFRGLAPTSTQRHEIEFAPDNLHTFLRLNGTGTTWAIGGTDYAASTLDPTVAGDLTKLFAIEDRILHYVDKLHPTHGGPYGPYKGFVDVVTGNAFITDEANSGLFGDGSIQRGVDIVASGGTVNVEAGTYVEAVTVNKAVTIDGEGNGAVPLATLTTPTSGAFLINITSTTSADDVTIRDLAFQGVNGPNTAAVGVNVPGSANFDTLTIERATFTNLFDNGVEVFGDSVTGASAQNVVIDSSTFTNNGNNTGGAGDISFFTYNQDATLSNLVLSNDGVLGARLGIQFRGVGAGNGVFEASMGTVQLDDVTITGKYRTQFIGIQRYSDVNNLTLNDVELGGATSEITGGFGALLRFDAVGSGSIAAPALVDLGNTYFHGVAFSSAQKTDLEFAPDNTFAYLLADAKDTLWDVGANVGVAASTIAAASTADAYDIEDRILHYVDALNSGQPYKGWAEIRDGHSYVTSPGSIQRAVDAVDNPGVVHIKGGAYTGSVSTAGKSVTLSIGASPAQVTITGDVTLDGDDTLLIDDILGTNAATQYDNLVVSGSVDLGGATLSVPSLGYSPAQGDTLDIIDASALTGTFSNFVQGAVVIGGFRINYNVVAGDVELIQNSNPVAVDGGPYTIAEGDSLNLDGSGSYDADAPLLTDSIVSYEWDIDNDGQFDDAFGSTPTLTWSQLQALGLNDGFGVYTIHLRVTDELGATGVDSTTVTITNTPPTIGLSGANSTNEGAVYSLMLGTPFDPGADTITNYAIHWGDGNTDNYTPAQIAMLGGVVTHTYADDNPTATLSDPYTITVDLTDEDGTFLAGSKNITVNNTNPTAITLTLPSINEGSSGTVTVTSVTDAGADSFTYSYVVKKNGATYDSSGGFIPANSFSFTPDDMDPGFTWTLDVQVQDDDGGLFTQPTQTLTVLDVAPTVNIVSRTTPINENTATTLVFNLVDPGLGDRLSTQQVVVNWGDLQQTEISALSNPALLTALQNGLTVSLNHTYTDDNPAGTSSDIYSITFDSRQLNGIPVASLQLFSNMGLAITSVPRDVTVVNLNPTGFFVTTTPSVPAGSPVSVNWLLPSDPSPNDAAILRYTYFIDADNDLFLDSGEEILPASMFGDGTYAGSTTNSGVTIPGTYFGTPGVYNIASQIRDDDGGVSTQSVAVTITPTTFRVQTVTWNDSGFRLTFNRAADPDDVNLYNWINSGVGGPTVGNANLAPVDLVITGPGGAVNGSLIWNSTYTGFDWVKTGGPLDAGNYSILLRSGNGRFEDALGEDLDGNVDNVAGGDYTSPALHTVTVAPGSRIVGVMDFARGASATTSQPINLPHDNTPSGAGIPVTIDNGAGVTAVDFQFVYDAGVLDIPAATAVDASSFVGLPPGWSVTVAFLDFGATSGPARVNVTLSIASMTPLTAGPHELVRILSTVRTGSTYGAAEVLQLNSLRVNENTIPSRANFGVHKAVFVGDADQSGAYNAPDVSFISGVVADSAQPFTGIANRTGFRAYPTVDPIVVADITRDGSMSGLDASWLAQKLAYIALPLPAFNQPEIPDYPPGMVAPFAGIDPTVDMDDLVLGAAGSSVTVPIRVTDSLFGTHGFTVSGQYDTTKLNLTAADFTLNGALAADGFVFSNISVNDAAGAFVVTVSTSSTEASELVGPQNAFSVEFDIAPSAPSGVAAIDVGGIAGPDGDGFVWTFVDGSILIDAIAPRVTQVFADSSLWSADFRDYVDGGLDDGGAADNGFDDVSANADLARGYPISSGAGQLTTLPWVNVDRLKVVFSENVGASLTAADFSLVLAANFIGLNSDFLPGSLPTISSISYDSATFTATLNLSHALESTAFDLDVAAASVSDAAGNSLDGEWTNAVSSYPSGNGVPGGNFSLRMLSLPGDALDDFGVTGQRIVDSDDGQFVRDAQNGFVVIGLGTLLGYDARADVDGDGFVNSDDGQDVRDAQNAFLFQTGPFVPVSEGASLSFMSGLPLPAVGGAASMSSTTASSEAFAAVFDDFAATATNSTSASSSDVEDGFAFDPNGETDADEATDEAFEEFEQVWASLV